MATVTTGLTKLALPGATASSEHASFYRRSGKRLLDIAASFVGLVVSSPVLIICALLVRLTSRGPILFRQIRIGYLGRPFTMVKFRTMVTGAETLGSSVVVIRDPRLTPVGSFLRRTKLDELPQLINVLRGEMSFVGPRPRVPNEVDNDDPRERILQRVRPGVTSYASIHHRMEADYCARQANPQAVYRSSLLPQKRSLDCEYVNNLTLRLDLKLLFLTIVLVSFPGNPRIRGLRTSGPDGHPYSRDAQLLLDWFAYMAAAWLAYSVRYEAGFLEFYRRQMWCFIAVIPAIRVLANRCLGVYDMMWRYVTLDDAASMAAALSPVTLVLCLLRLGLPVSFPKAVIFLVPLSITALEFLLALSSGLAIRGLRRMLYMLQHRYQPLPESAHRVLIFGAGMLGLMTAQDIRQYPHLSVVGFVDDDPAKNGKTLAGRRVLGNPANLESLCARHDVTDMMICAKSIDLHRRFELGRLCEALGVKVHVLPSLDQLLRDGNDLSKGAPMSESVVAVGS